MFFQLKTIIPFHIVVQSRSSDETLSILQNPKMIEFRGKEISPQTIQNIIKGQGVKYFENLKANHHVRFNDEMKGVLLWEIQNFENGEEEDENE